MSQYIEDVLNQTSKLDWAFPFQRTGAFPLDRSSLFSSLDDALNYATSIDSPETPMDERELGGTAYVGQIISVLDDTLSIDDVDNRVSAYIITENGGLEKLATTTITSTLDKAIEDLATLVSKNTESITDLDTRLKEIEAKDIVSQEELASEVSSLQSQISNLVHFDVEIVDDIDTVELKEHILYLVKATIEGNEVENTDYYYEYIAIPVAEGSSELEAVLIGDTTTDLSGYFTVEQAEQLLGELENKFDTLEASLTNYYTKTEVDNLIGDLNGKSNVAEAINALNEAVYYKIATDAEWEDFDSTSETVISYIDRNYISNEELGSKPVYTTDEEGNKTLTTAGTGIYTNIYTKEEVSDLVSEITGGESAADVLTQLTEYKTTNDARVKIIEDNYISTTSLETTLANYVTNDTLTSKNYVSYDDTVVMNSGNAALN